MIVLKLKANEKPGIERVQALADISRLAYVIATKPMHRLQIRQ